eukprot:TRINITY_DN47545_c0_g1_i1.p1 TRINITY_DN47545_c0_g1~~TRINITY_DN47545_c0_g1_i1.p1  ORF type:complete len:251 (+),score=39.20 TRINITY_DN47545_c0_g1_i1:76-828(+)
MPCELGFLGHHGSRLTSSDEAALQRAVPLLGYEYGDTVQFWGKVLGTGNDYLVCQGSDGDVLLFSDDGGVKWYLVPRVDEKAAEACRKIRGAYMGDPGYGYVVDGTAIKELQRLSVFIQDCDANCAVVPRGAFTKNELGTIEVNTAFSGIPPSHAGKLNSYLHRPFNHTHYEIPLLKAESSIPSIDISESIASDIPQGIWCLKLDHSLGTIFGSSLLFPGAVWYHKPNTPIYGYYYIGDGQPDRDVAFSL